MLIILAAWSAGSGYCVLGWYQESGLLGVALRGIEVDKVIARQAFNLVPRASRSSSSGHAASKPVSDEDIDWTQLLAEALRLGESGATLCALR